MIRPLPFTHRPTALIALLLLTLSGCLQDAGREERQADTLQSQVEELERQLAAQREELEQIASENEAARLAVEREEQMRQEEEQARLEAEQAALAEQQRQAEARERRQAELDRLAAEREADEERARELGLWERELAEREARIEAEVAEQSAEIDPSASPSPAPEDGTEASASPPRQATLSPGTVLHIEIDETLSSETHRVGDRFDARLARDLYGEGGELAVRAGAPIRGEVIEVTPLKRVGGQASIAIAFNELILPSGETLVLEASMSEQGRSAKGERKKIVVGAIAGAVLGRVLGGKGGGEVLAGAAVGAAAGTAVVASKADGKAAVIPRGETVGLVLEEVVTVTTEMKGLVDADDD